MRAYRNGRTCLEIVSAYRRSTAYLQPDGHARFRHKVNRTIWLPVFRSVYRALQRPERLGSIEANWNKQYYLTVNSEFGNPYGSDWYDGGQIANFGINIHREPAGFWNQQLFYGWDGSSKTPGTKGTVLMNEPKTITAQWSDDSSIAFLNIGIIAALLVVASLGYSIMKKRVKSLSSQSSSDGKQMDSQDEASQIWNEYSEDKKK